VDCTQWWAFATFGSGKPKWFFTEDDWIF
jgi:hypothetical protein